MSATPVAVFISLFKSVAGSGVLAMPYCFMRAGVVPSAVLVLLVWMATVRTIQQLCTCAMELEGTMIIPIKSPDRGIPPRINKREERDDEPISYLHLCNASFGPNIGGWLSWGGVVPSQWIAGAGGANLCGAKHKLVRAVATLLQCLMCAPRSTAYLEYTSLFGNLAFASGIGAVLLYSVFVKGLHPEGVVLGVNSVEGTFEALGILFFAFAAQPEALGVLSSADAAACKTFNSIVFKVFALVLVVFAGFAGTVYCAFGMDTKAVLFDNLPRDGNLMNLLRIALSVMLMCNYPLSLFPVFHVFEKTLVDSHSVPCRIFGRSTTGVIAIACGGGLGPISAIGGGLSALTCFILPPLFHLALTLPEHVSALSRFVDYSVVAFGIVGGALSLGGGFASLMKP